jgi:hypothetical protein
LPPALPDLKKTKKDQLGEASEKLLNDIRGQMKWMKIEELWTFDENFEHLWGPLRESLEELVRVNVCDEFYPDDSCDYAETIEMRKRMVKQFNSRPDIIALRKARQRTTA